MTSTVEWFCTNCRHDLAAGSRTCEHCGLPTPPESWNAVPAPRSAEATGDGEPMGDAGGSATPGDLVSGTTRYLAAAAHLRDDVAEALIAEFLSERRRSIPRSPGVDAAAVLGDAAASHRRRQIRDSALLALAAVLLVVQPLLSLAWLAASVTLRRRVGYRKRGPTAAGRGRTTAAIGLTAIGTAAIVVALLITMALFDALFQGSTGAGGWFVVGAVTVLAIVAVLLADELLVLTLMRHHFSKENYRHEPEPTDSGVVAALRRIGRGRFDDILARARDADRHRDEDEAEVVVYRGDSPFVGAGVQYKDRRFTFLLEREDPDDPRPPEIIPQDLHDEMVDALSALRGRSSLSPHDRLGALRVGYKVFVPVADLIDHWPSPEAEFYLPDGVAAPPRAGVPQGVVRSLIARPREWTRPYLYCEVESWKRDLAVSFFVRLGTDGRTLTLTWVPCVLGPIDAAYKKIDNRYTLTRQALHRAREDVLLFPTTLAERAHRLCRRFRPVRTDRHEVALATYGASTSLREYAVAPSRDYLRSADALDYVAVFDTTLLQSVRAFLRARGLKVADFDQKVNQFYSVYANDSVVAMGNNNTATGASAPPSGGPV